MRTLLELYRLLRPRRRDLVPALVADVAAPLLALVPPYLLAHAIDDAVVPSEAGDLDRYVIALAVTVALLALATLAQEYLAARLAQRALANVRHRTLEHMQALPVSYHDRVRTGTVLSRLTNDVEVLEQLLNPGLPTLASATVALVGTPIAMALLDWQLALVSLFVFPAIALTARVYERRTAPAVAATRDTAAAVTAELQETLTGMETVHAFGQEERHRRSFAELVEADRRANARADRLGYVFGAATPTIAAAAKGVIVLVGGLQVAAGDMSVGVLIGFLAYLQNLFSPIGQLAGFYAGFVTAMGALRPIRELLDEPEEADAAGAVELPPTRGPVTVTDVSFAYGPAAPPALDRVELELAPGETLALVGHNGAGKSTLAKLLLRFAEPDGGRVAIGGKDLLGVTRSSLRRRVGYCQQEQSLLAGASVRENVAIGRPGADDRDVREALSAVGAGDLAGDLPEGLETAVEEDGRPLSAGQRQLVALARLALADPEIVVLDEATSQLDPITEARVQLGIERVLAGRTVLAIAHRPTTIRSADRIAVMASGRVVEQGTHHQLIAAGGVYAKLAGEA